MKKDFDEWNELKKKLDGSYYNFEFSEGKIWWSSLGVNIGNEQNGRGKKSADQFLFIEKLIISCFTAFLLLILHRIKPFGLKSLKLMIVFLMPNSTKLIECPSKDCLNQ